MGDNTKNRMSRDKMFMEIAKTIAQRGTCNRARVGAVLVGPGHKIISIGYNGSPKGEPHCDEVGHILFKDHCIRTIHAEENCLDGVTLDRVPYTLYVTHYPCAKCQVTLFEKLMESGATMLVIYGERYGESTFFEELKEVHGRLQFSKFQED